MKIAVAQLRPTVGPVEQNIDLHLSLVDLGVHQGANLIIFPELSLTGYEPSLAAELARSVHDSCLTEFQNVCDKNNLAVGVGLPLRTNTLPHISTLIFRPNSSPHVYSKRHLHEDEKPFFSHGNEVDSTIHEAPKISLAICYELSIPEHAEMAFTGGATAYIASVAKTERGVKQASDRLSELANQHSALVMMSNCVGILDGTKCTGSSTIWGRNGAMLARLDSSSNGVIVVDFDTEDTVTDMLA